MTETKYCPKCKSDVELPGWILNKARIDGLSSYCRSCHNQINLAGARERRAEFLLKMGGTCTRCGFSDLRALQVDHVNGNGNAERKAGVNQNTARFRQAVLDDLDQYQLLCANCNTIKRIENEEHRETESYSHQKPTQDRERSPGKHSHEANLRRSEGVNRYWETAESDKKREIARARTQAYNDSLTEEQKKEISAKISASRRGLKKGPDGKMYRPNP